MGNFLLIQANSYSERESGQLFEVGIAMGQRLKGSKVGATIQGKGLHVGTFPRLNGTSVPLISDPGSGNWLLVTGVWFHNEGYGVGQELKLLRRYIEVGPMQLAGELEGFFTVVAGNLGHRETILITDIVGSCHSFVRFMKNGLAISSSSLLLAGLEESTLDHIACQEFLATGIIYEDRTIHTEVRKLEAATVFHFREGELESKRQYWRSTDLEPESLDSGQAISMLREQLTHATSKVAKVFPRIVCDLTGGYDSRAVVAAFLAAGHPVSVTVTGDLKSADVNISKGLADMLCLEHVHLAFHSPLSFEQVKSSLRFTDGEYDLCEYARIMGVHQSLAARFDVSVNGSFGEVARGYWWELLFPYVGACSPIDAAKVARKRYAVGTFDDSIIARESRLSLGAHFREVVERAVAGMGHFPNTFQMDHLYLTLRMQHWQGRIASSTNQLWPCFSPFMFRSVIEVMLQVKSRIRRRSLLIRKLLASMYPRCSDYPLEYGYPATVANYKNIFRFWPVPVYYGGKVLDRVRRSLFHSRAAGEEQISRSNERLGLWAQEEVQDLLRPKCMESRGIFDVTALNHFLDRSRQQVFPFHEQWSKVLSLGYALRILNELRAKSSMRISKM